MSSRGTSGSVIGTDRGHCLRQGVLLTWSSRAHAPLLPSRSGHLPLLASGTFGTFVPDALLPRLHVLILQSLAPSMASPSRLLGAPLQTPRVPQL